MFFLVVFKTEILDLETFCLGAPGEAEGVGEGEGESVAVSFAWHVPEEGFVGIGVGCHLHLDGPTHGESFDEVDADASKDLKPSDVDVLVFEVVGGALAPVAVVHRHVVHREVHDGHAIAESDEGVVVGVLRLTIVVEAAHDVVVQTDAPEWGSGGKRGAVEGRGGDAAVAYFGNGKDLVEEVDVEDCLGGEHALVGDDTHQRRGDVDMGRPSAEDGVNLMLLDGVAREGLAPHHPYGEEDEEERQRESEERAEG